MARIKLFSPDGAAAGSNCYFLRNELKIPYEYTDVYGNPRTGNIDVHELGLRGDRRARSHYASLMEFAGEAPPSDWPDIAQLNTHGLDPVAVLSEMYRVLERERHKRKETGHVTGGEAEDFITGLSIVQNDPNLPSHEIGALLLTPTEFRDIALHVSGRAENPAIAAKIDEIRTLCGYQAPDVTEEKGDPARRIGGRDPRALRPGAAAIGSGAIGRV